MHERFYRVREDRPNGLPPVERTYRGFDRAVGCGPRYLALVSDEGDLDVYGLTDPTDLSGLVEYLSEHRPMATILGVYHKETK